MLGRIVRFLVFLYFGLLFLGLIFKFIPKIRMYWELILIELELTGDSFLGADWRKVQLFLVDILAKRLAECLESVCVFCEAVNKDGGLDNVSRY
jgi:hypothetical protein